MDRGETMSEQAGAPTRIAGPREPVEGGTPPVIDAAFARWLADRAGQALLQVREDLGYADADALKAAGDKAAHDLLRTELARWRPADAVLSEEDDHSRLAWQEDRHDAVRPDRLDASRVWIIDPLDGTREFSEVPRDDWAVHVALWEDGRLVAGAVAQPGLDTTFSTADVPRVSAFSATRPRVVASRTRPPAFVEALAEAMDAELVPMGSAGAKVMAIVRDVADAYVHAGGQYEWDSAAPVVVARAAGLHTSRIDGGPLVYNQDDVSLPDLIVCRPELSEEILAFVRRHGTA